MGCAFDRSLQKRAFHCLFDSFQCFVVSFCMSDTDMCDTLVCHNSLNIGKIEVDQCRQIDQVCNTLNRLLKDFVCFLECFRHGCTAVYNLKQLIIWDYNQCIYVFLQILNACQSIVHTCSGLKTERFGNDTNGQDAHLLCNTCHYRRSTSSGSATHTTGDKDHICTLHSLSEFF